MKPMTGGLPPMDLLRGIVLDDKRDLPLHAQLRNSLQRLILEHFKDQQRFYSETQIIKELKISQGTVRRSLADLVTAGLLERRPARGTLVRRAEQSTGLHNLAVFLPEFSSYNISRMLTLLNEQCLNRGMRMHAFYTHRGERLAKAYEQLKFSPQEGAVVLLSNSPQATMELGSALEDKGYRYAVADTLLRSARQNYVGVDNRAGIAVGLKHLTDLGHREIVLLVNEPEENENVRERMAAFEEYMALFAPGTKTRICHAGVHLWETFSSHSSKVLESLWHSSPRPTAIFAISDFGAISAIAWLQKKGIVVPRDVSVFGFDGVDFGAMIHPALTTLEQPFRKITETIFEVLEGTSTEVRQVFHIPELLRRESTSAPPR
jgi:DNA-binding LacI/PurR family transcriptional regulator